MGSLCGIHAVRCSPLPGKHIGPPASTSSHADADALQHLGYFSGIQVNGTDGTGAIRYDQRQ
jgi:hypothetical protein